MATLGVPIQGALGTMFWGRPHSEWIGEEGEASNFIAKQLRRPWVWTGPSRNLVPPSQIIGAKRECDEKLSEITNSDQSEIFRKIGDVEPMDRQTKLAMHAPSFVEDALERHTSYGLDSADWVAAKVFDDMPNPLLGALEHCLNHSLLRQQCLVFAQRKLDNMDPETIAEINMVRLRYSQYREATACYLVKKMTGKWVP